MISSIRALRYVTLMSVGHLLLLGSGAVSWADSAQGNLVLFADERKTFSVEFPDAANVKKIGREVSILGTRIPTRMYTASSGDLFLGVMAMDIEAKDIPGNRTAREVANDVLQGAFDAGGLAVEGWKHLPTRKGCEAVGAAGKRPGIAVRYHVHVCGDRSFQVQAISRGDIASDRSARRFLDSFRPASKM